MSDSGEVRPPNLRDEKRMNIHRVVKCLEGGVVSDVNPDGRHYVWKKPDGEARWLALHELVDRLAEEHRIDDLTGLEDAVDNAMLIYRGRSALPKADVKQLVKFIPEVTEVLFREENDLRIADIMMDRDRLPFEGDGWSYEKTLATIRRIWQIRADLAQLACVLRQLPKTSTPDLKEHRMVASLERFWKSLPGKKLTRTFTPRDPKTKRQLAASDAMKFIESVVQFIAPEVVKKLPNLTRHRTKLVAKPRA